MDTLYYWILLALVLPTNNVEAQDFIAFIPDTEYIFENRTENCVTLMRAGTANGDITVSYTIGGIGITSPEDFVSGDFQILYPAALSTIKINVTFNDNTVCNTDPRLINVTLTSVDKGSLITTPVSKFVQVLDDDGDFIAFIPDTEYIFENRTENCVTLMRAGTANGDITVSYTIGGIGITSPEDFVSGDFQILYPPVSSTIKINVTFNDNTVCNTDPRLINVTLTSVDKGSLITTPVSKFVQVLDDDGDFIAFIPDTEYIFENRTENCVTLMRSGTANGDITVSYTIGGIGITSPEDFICNTESRLINVTLTSVDKGSLVTTPVSKFVQVLDDDGDFIAFIPDTEYTFENRTENCVTLMRSGTANGDITVSYTIGGIGITSPEDFVSGDFQIVYPPASSTIKINVTFNDNTICNTESRLINVTLTSVDKGSLVTTPVSKFVQVLDDDGDFIAFIPDTEYIFENRTENCVTLMRAGTANGDITVSYTIGGIGITSPEDFVSGDFQIVYPPASSTIKINVTFNDNTICNTESRLINVTLTSVDKGSLVTTPVSKFVQVLDDDGDFIAFIPDKEYIFENRTENCVTLMRAGTANGDITVSYTIGGIGITSPEDFVSGDFQIVYPPASSTIKINVTFNDNTICNTESRLINVTLTSVDKGSLVTTPVSKFVQVLDDDGDFIAFIPDTEYIFENRTENCVTLMRAGTANGDITVSYTIGGIGITSPEDFVSGDFQIVYPPASSTIKINVTFNDNTICNTESRLINVTLTSVDKGSLVTTPVSKFVQVLDDDGDFIAFIPDTEYIFENRTENCVTLMRAGTANGDITVSYTIGGIGITSPEDFVSGDFQIVYPPASSTIKINVTFNDNTICNTESRLINVTLTSVDKGSLVTTPVSKFVQVLDDDGDFIAFIPDTEYIFENRTENCVTLMRAGTANGDITVSYTIGGIGITSPEDFVSGDFQIVYPPASSTIKINVTFNDNTICNTESRLINVTLTSVDKGSLVTTPVSKFVQVLDDDGDFIAFIPDTEYIFENRTENCVTLMRAGTANGDITVSYTIGGIGITSPEDFVSGDFQIVYPPASSTIKINVTFNDNTDISTNHNTLTYHNFHIDNICNTFTNHNNDVNTNHNTITNHNYGISNTPNTFINHNYIIANHNTLTYRNYDIDNNYNTFPNHNYDINTNTNTITNHNYDGNTDHNTITNHTYDISTNHNTITNHNYDGITDYNTITNHTNDISTDHNTITNHNNDIIPTKTPSQTTTTMAIPTTTPSQTTTTTSEPTTTPSQTTTTMAIPTTTPSQTTTTTSVPTTTPSFTTTTTSITTTTPSPTTTTTSIQTTTPSQTTPTTSEPTTTPSQTTTTMAIPTTTPSQTTTTTSVPTTTPSFTTTTTSITTTTPSPTTTTTSIPTTTPSQTPTTTSVPTTTPSQTTTTMAIPTTTPSQTTTTTSVPTTTPSFTTTSPSIPTTTPSPTTTTTSLPTTTPSPTTTTTSVPTTTPSQTTPTTSNTDHNTITNHNYDISTNYNTITNHNYDISTNHNTITNHNYDGNTDHNTITNHNYDINTNHNTITNHTYDISTNHDTITNHNYDISTNHSTITNHNYDINTNHSTITNNNYDGNTDHNTITNHNYDISTNHNTITNHNYDINTNHSTITNHNYDGNTDHNTITNHNYDISTNHNTITNHNYDINTNHNTITNHNYDGNTDHNTITNHTYDISTNHNTITNHNYDISTNHNTITNHNYDGNTDHNTITNHNNDISTNHNTITNHTYDISTNHNTITNHNYDINTNHNTITNHNYDGNTDHNTITNHTYDISTNHNTITNHNYDISTNHNTITNHNYDGNTDHNTITNHNNDISTNHNTITNHTYDISTNHNTITNHNYDGNTDHNTITNHNYDISTNHSTITNHNNDISTNHNTITNHIYDINTNHNTITNHNYDISYNHNTITNHNYDGNTDHNTITNHNNYINTNHNTITNHNYDNSTNHYTITNLNYDINIDHNTITNNNYDGNTNHNTITNHNYDISSNHNTLIYHNFAIDTNGNTFINHN
ncbi:mucin-3A-like [Haliotis rufescens]|uniref:mucin-3A-like n=1 Tax=Haliotis rufescens TaxID=6454 RepID=UPI00201F4617|nr:mucin-3A-like [Haliotis rufescens]